MPTAHAIINHMASDNCPTPTPTPTMASSWLLSPAKLNLFLHITGRRADGYHDLQTLFRLVNWGDAMRFEPLARQFVLADYLATKAHIKKTESTKKESTQTSISPIHLSGADGITPSVTDNLIHQATDALLSYVAEHATAMPVSLPIIDISLDKRIPTGAGLGGGSSNAATALLMLNHLWQLGLSNPQLQAIGRTLGADVPIFVLGQDAYATGIGDVLEPVRLPNQRHLLLLPQAHIATAQLFAHAQLQRNLPMLSTAELVDRQDDYLFRLVPPFCNVFEPVVRQLSDDVASAFDALWHLCHTHKLSATPRLTGSGACVFLPIDDDTDPTLLQPTLLQYWQQHWHKNALCRAVVVESLGWIT